MKILKFNPDKITSEDIRLYYLNALSALNNQLLHSERDYPFLTQQERRDLLDSARVELSVEAGFMLLAYVESLFRSDFVFRVESRKWNDPLTKYFKRTYNPSAKLYQYKLDDIFHGWRCESGECDRTMVDIIANLPQYFAYRNWIAHGRYWMFKEEDYIRRYKFEAICVLVDKIHKHFGDKFKCSKRMGEHE